MNIYTISKTKTIKVRAKDKESALQFASEHPAAWKETQDVEVIDGDFIDAKKEMLRVLEAFHGSSCEREFMNICTTYKNSGIVAGMRAMADFVEKGEYKNYGGVMKYEWDDDPILVLYASTEDEEEVSECHYCIGRRYDINDDIARLKKTIADWETTAI